MLPGMGQGVQVMIRRPLVTVWDLQCTDIWDDPAVVAAGPVMVDGDVVAGDGNSGSVVVANAVGSAACP